MKKNKFIYRGYLLVFVLMTLILFITSAGRHVKTEEVRYSTYEEKIQIDGFYFTQENVIYNGNLDGFKLRYKNGERVAKDKEIWNGINSPEAGIIVYQIDGFENKYNLTNITEITEEEMKKMQNGDLNEGIKIVNNSTWYICAKVMPEVSEFFKKGMVKEILINEKIYIAEVFRNIKNKDGDFIIFKLRSDFDILNLHRTFSGYIIKSRYKGLIVPLKAVCEEDGSKGVFIKKNGYAEFRKADVIYQGNDIAVIRPNEKSRKKISEFDKVIINPDGLKTGKKVR